ncbi:hypothetical protein [Paraliomyxa miuraensis]|uniref:hypothetical protein n=1 Tax=Paraliomyxa miuraensis TaxID=376150 RepID=UPI0022501FC3|nr:hypothetical protein [Paraliomyxa miuraensis]MCX4243096.1 hypothetical protein [Paraliomyxa miuraensis]
MLTFVRRRRVVLPAWLPGWLPVGLGAALALAGTGAGCGKQTQPVTAPDAGGGGTAVVAAPELAPIEHPSQMMPRDTSVLVVGSSVTRAAEVFERDRLVKAFGPQYTSIRSIITSTLGYDLLDPGQWREAGLDPDGAAGLAVSDLASGRVVLFATIANRTKVVELVRRVAGKAQVEIVEQSYGPSASVLRAKGEGGGAVVLRDQWVALVLDDGDPKVDLAERLVTMDPNVSLAAQVGYRKATGGMRAADLSVYFDLAGMVARAHAEARIHASKPDTSWAEEELARAKEEGTPEQVAALERQVQEQEQWQERWERRQEGERALGELLVSGIEGVGFSTTVKRSGPVFDGRVVAGPEAFLRRLMINREGSPVLPTAMNGAPLWCGSGRMDPKAAFELLEAMAESDGKDYAELLAEAKAELGIDLKADLEPVFEGHAELCMTVDGSLEELMGVEAKERLGMGAFVQVTDQAKAKYLVAKMANSGSALGKRMRKQGEGYVVDAPDWRPVHVQPVGSRIVVSTDPELGKRIAAGDPGSMPSKIRPPGARGALDLGGTAATQAFDLSTGMLFLMVGRSGSMDPVVLAPGLTPEEMEKVPMSAATKKARKALDKAQADVDRLERKRNEAQMKQALAMTDGLGMLIGALTEDDRGFVLSGGQFLRAPSLGAVIETLVTGVMSEGPGLDPADAKALDEAWERHMKASQAYSEARMADAEKWKKKRGR